MNARLFLLVAVLLGLASLSRAAGAGAQARTALDTARVYDGTATRAEAFPVYAGERRGRPADPEALAAEERARAQARAALKPAGQPLEPPQPKKEPLTAWNPLLNGAKGAILMGMAGFTLGGPLGMLVGAAVGGLAAWGLTKIGDA